MSFDSADSAFSLIALSPLDGRYARATEPLRPLLSEAGFMRYRVRVEISWLLALTEIGLAGLAPLSASARAQLALLAHDFGVADAARVKEIEKKTNHDVKAVEYW